MPVGTNAMNFNDDLNRVLKYSTDTIRQLLTELSKPEYNEHRWNDPQPEAGLRGILADALQDRLGDTTDRTEAHSLTKQIDLLRRPNQHVVIDGDKVRAGKFTDRHILQAAQRLADSMEHRTGFDPLDRIDLIDDHHTGNRYYRPEDFQEPFEPLGYGQLRVIHLSPDDYHSHIDLHHSELGNHLADRINSEADGAVDWEAVPDDDSDYGRQTIDNEEEALRKAPYEEVDPSHSSERDNGFGFDDPSQRKY